MGARAQVPFAPGRDHLDRGIKGIGGQLEADLVIALAGGAMGNGVGAGFLSDFDKALGDQRTGNGGAEQVLAFIDCIGAEHREDEIAHELFAQVFDADVLDAEHFGFLARRFQLFALAEVSGEGHHFAIVGLLQPFQDDGGVEAARIGQHDLLDFIRHDVVPRSDGDRIGHHVRNNLAIIASFCHFLADCANFEIGGCGKCQKCSTLSIAVS